MKINELIKRYNFHDSYIENFTYDKTINKMTLNLKIYGSLNKEFNKENIQLIFNEIENYKNNANSNIVGEYVLNIWKTKGTKNSVELILDDDEYSIIYFDAKSVDIICWEKI